MEPKFKSSFIPKKSLEIAAKVGRRGGGSVAVVPFLSLIIFLGSVALSVGVFLYQQFLIQNIDRKEEALASAREALRSPLIEELVRLDARIVAAEEVLDSHLILSAFFDLLEEKTLSNVRFSNFSYTVLEDGTIDVSMNGIARSFNAIAVQSEVFGEDRLMRGSVFSNLNVGQDGNVVFNFNTSLDPRLLFYTLALDKTSGSDVVDEDNEEESNQVKE